MNIFNIIIGAGLIFLLSWSGRLQAQPQPPKPQAYLPNEELSKSVMAVPLPIEVLVLLKNSATPYAQILSEPPYQIKNARTNHEKLFYLGAYAAALAYANVYKNKAQALNILKPITQLVARLGIEKRVNLHNLKQAIRQNDFEQLLNKTNYAIEAITDHYMNINRYDLACLVVAGGWYQTLRIMTATTKILPGNRLGEQMATQAIALEQLMLLLYFFEDKPHVQRLITALIKLQHVFDNIKQNITYPTRFRVLKDWRYNHVMVTDNAATQVFFLAKDVKEITRLVNLFRYNTKKK